MSKRKKADAIAAPVAEAAAEPAIGTLFWHIHHEELVEPLTEPVSKRVEFIHEHKARYESEAQVALRLRLIKPVVGTLPEPVTAALAAMADARTAQAAVLDADQAAWAAFSFARDQFLEAEREKGTDFVAAYPAYPDDIEVLRVAWIAAQKTSTTRWETTRAAIQAANLLMVEHRDALEALHKTECTDCPWDGVTIFSDAFWKTQGVEPTKEGN